MSGLDEVRAERIKKLNILKEQGIDSYVSEVSRTHTIADALGEYDALAASGEIITVVGRVMVVRGQGAIMFVVLKDATGTIQAVFKEDSIEAKLFNLFKDTVDGGDFIAVTGTLFTTQRGERSVLVESWRMVTKSLLPLPDKYHGLQDEDERLRKRYLDLLTRDELRELFTRKAKFWDVTRTFMKEQGFLEVETPTLELTTGGAEARPFATHHNDYDLDVFLRISVGEMWQKRLLAGGFEKTFEIGRVYRNEGSSLNHLQEFTNLEFYQAFADYEDGMKLVENLYRTIAQEVYGTTKFTRGDYTFDLHDEWVHLDYAEEVKRQTGIDIEAATEEEIVAKLRELGISYEGNNKERLIDTLWKYCRKHIAGPAFLINHPKLVSPLAKAVPGKPNATQRFQPIIAGTEVGNGYSELNDPLEQRARFELQQALIERGDAEAMMPDYEFVEMLEHGMPPACGFGFGERLFTILEGRPIRDVQLFPLVKPKSEIKNTKDKEVAVIVVDRNLLSHDWQVMNTVAHTAASFAARLGRKLFFTDEAKTRDGYSVLMNIQYPIIIKQSPNLGGLLENIPPTCQAFPFTREMLDTSNDKIVLEKTRDIDFSDLAILGVLLFGPKSVVDEFTKDIPLYS